MICPIDCDHYKEYRKYLSKRDGDIEFVSKGYQDVLRGKYPGIGRRLNKIAVSEEKPKK
jgi:hypothetical protein